MRGNGKQEDRGKERGKKAPETGFEAGACSEFDRWLIVFSFLRLPVKSKVQMSG